MSQIVLEPEITDGSSMLGRWMVLIFNNETNSMDEVVDILMIATQCDLNEAMIETWEANAFGKAAVHFSTCRTECDAVAAIISSIGVKTEVAREWRD